MKTLRNLILRSNPEMAASIYPKSPTHFPKKKVSFSSSYRQKAFLAILSLLLFFISYAVLILGACYLIYITDKFTALVISPTGLTKICAIAGAAAPLLFTLKFLFYVSNPKRVNRIRLVKNEHPLLWDFVHKIVKETGAPKPKRIYIDPDVNAYVSYTNAWLSLFLPVGKELTIGLGLVSCLNLSEFKAVISHEFGHFSQRSMMIGSYLMSANTIIHDLVFSRDEWDDALERLKGLHLRYSVFAWIATTFIETIRQFLSIAYQPLNEMYSALSREMELYADKVAVSTSGSDAIISALWKLESGRRIWNNTLNQAYTAAQHQKNIKNLYDYHMLIMERLAEKQDEILNNLPEDDRGGKKFFVGPEVSKVKVYSNHPPNHIREENAKVPYVACQTDRRSPWSLFATKAQLQEEMTALLYRENINEVPESYISLEEFEAFIIAENKGQELHREYYNKFRNRSLQIPEMEALQEEAQKFRPPLSTKLDKLKADLLVLKEDAWKIETLLVKAQQIAEGVSEEKLFTFEGKKFEEQNIKECILLLERRRQNIFQEKFKEWDHVLCAIHLAMAKIIGKDSKLLEVYRQHDALNHIYQEVARTKNMFFRELRNLQARGNITQDKVTVLTLYFQDAYQELNKGLALLDTITFVPMPNIESLEELKEAIIKGGIFKKGHGQIFENGSLDKMIDTLEKAYAHCQRLNQKSIGFILLEHKALQLEMVEI